MLNKYYIYRMCNLTFNSGIFISTLTYIMHQTQEGLNPLQLIVFLEVYNHACLEWGRFVVRIINNYHY